MRASTISCSEILESRVLLSGSALKPAMVAKLGSNLAAIYQQYKAEKAAGNSRAAVNFAAADDAMVMDGSRLRLEAFANGSPAKLASDLKKIGAKKITRNKTGVSVSVGVDQLAKLGKLKSLRFARPSHVITNVGAITSQGGDATRATIARSTYGVDGTGVKIGLMSDSFNTSGNGSYALDVATGDLPPDVQILSDAPGQTDEGRGMAQLVYDAAPGASLAFSTAYNTEGDFAQHILDLANAGSNVIVDDVIYLEEPMFQDGVVAQAVDQVKAQGVSYFSSAGNQERASYESAWRSGPTLNAGSILPSVNGEDFFGGTTMDFDPGAGVDNLQRFEMTAGQFLLVAFQWDSPAFSANGSVGSPNDLDAYILNDAGTQVMTSGATANIGGDPFEYLFLQNNTGSTQHYNLMFTTAQGPTPGQIKWVEFYRRATTFEFATNSGSTYGHSSANGAESVAAAFWVNTPAFGVTPPTVETFSSAGPTKILFDAAGNRLGLPDIRQKPEITSVDGGNTTFFGFDVQQDTDTFPNFFGTSASAPEAASVAALMKQFQPAVTPDQIFAALESTAIDMDDPSTGPFDTGVDNRTGAGLIRADNAINALIQNTFTGSAVADDFLLRTDTSGSRIEVLLNNALVYSVPKANQPGIAFNLGDGNDSLTVSFANGSPITAGGVTCDGGAGSDSFIVTGTTGADALSVLATSILLGANGASFANVEQLIVNAGAGDDVITVLAATVPLTINAGVGDDTLNIIANTANGLTFDGGLTPTDDDSIVVFAGGAIVFNQDAGTSTAHLTISVQTAGTATFNASQTLEALTIATGGTGNVAVGGSVLLYVRSLNLEGSLDLADGDLIWDYSGVSPLSAARALLSAGYHDGDWQGVSGIRSSVAGADVTGVHAIAYVDSSQVGISSYRGKSFADGDAIVFRYTKNGDSDFDGAVDASADLTLYIIGLNADGSTWYEGDYTYDADVDQTSDLTLFIIGLNS